MSKDSSSSSSITVWSFPAFNFAILCSVVADAPSSFDVGSILFCLAAALPLSFVWAVIVECDFTVRVATYATWVFGALAVLSSYFVLSFCFLAVDDNNTTYNVFSGIAIFGLLLIFFLGWLESRASKDQLDETDKSAAPPISPKLEHDTPEHKSSRLQLRDTLQQVSPDERESRGE